MKHCLKYILLPLVFALFACENEAYDTGNGPLSDMRADFVEAQTDADARMASIETDAGERLYLTRAVTVGWMERPDTVYRALLYYNKVEADGGAYCAEPLGIMQVLVPPVTDIADVKDGLKADPVDFVSSWKSANGKYLTLNLASRRARLTARMARRRSVLYALALTTGPTARALYASPCTTTRPECQSIIPLTHT